jgi:hypothetical protein
MAEYIYPLATLVLDFFCVLLCIRYAVTRRSLTWIFPSLLSLTMLMGSVLCLLATATVNTNSTMSAIASYLSIFLFVASAIWLMAIIAFGLKMKRRLNEAAYEEAQFLSKRSFAKLNANIDRRPTAVHVISNTGGYASVPTDDPYESGPVRTRRPKRTAI